MYSKKAIWAVVLALIPAVLRYAIIPYPDSVSALLVLFVIPIFALALSLSAIHDIKSTPLLKGKWLAIVALIIALIWPVKVFF